MHLTKGDVQEVFKSEHYIMTHALMAFCRLFVLSRSKTVMDKFNVCVCCSSQVHCSGAVSQSGTQGQGGSTQKTRSSQEDHCCPQEKGYRYDACVRVCVREDWFRIFKFCKVSVYVLRNFSSFEQLFMWLFDVSTPPPLQQTWSSLPSWTPSPNQSPPPKPARRPRPPPPATQSLLRRQQLVVRGSQHWTLALTQTATLATSWPASRARWVVVQRLVVLFNSY